MSEVNTVQIPLNNRSDPALWVIMCESTFALATPKPITESVAKYNYIVANLTPNAASLVRDILMHPDAIDPYAQIKNELINRSGESSQQERLQSSVQAILAAVSNLTLNKATDIADRILEDSPSPIETFAVSNKKGTNIRI
ncbi:transposon Ty3-G Gag-Pol polyprotein [Trichonephila clavipes]|nr:transposon Ty3-G Gag-Pol polyprotein [Trichonephila clavipes]